MFVMVKGYTRYSSIVSDSLGGVLVWHYGTEVGSVNLQ